MNILRRAWWGIIRRWNQSLIVLLILLVIGTLVISSLLIQSATEKAKQEARKALGSEVILQSYDITGKKIVKQLYPISSDLAQSLIKNEYVDSYNYHSYLLFAAINFSAIPGETSDRVEVEITGEVPENFKQPDIQLDAVSDTSRLKEFKSGVHTLVEGRHITEDITNQPYVLIEQTIAAQNDLNVGDRLILNSFSGEPNEAEIIGIYRTSETIEDVRINQNMPTVLTLYSPYNKMYGNTNFLINDSTTNEITMGKLILYIDDPEHIESFINEEQSNVLLDATKFEFYSSEEKLKRMSLAIDQVASFTGMMLWLIIISGAIILCLLFIYFIKGRLREMGILLSLGEGRIKLVAQLIVETVLLVILAFSLSIFTGQFVAKQATDVLIEQRQAAIEKENQLQIQGAHMISGASNGQEAMIDTVEIKLSSDIGLRLIYVTCLILFISILYPAILIFRLKPTAILALQE